MNRFAVVLFFCLGFSGLAQASQEQERAQTLEMPCHALITQAECRSHHDRLASLPNGMERDAYLVQYLALVEERGKSCACSTTQKVVGVLRYR